MSSAVARSQQIAAAYTAWAAEHQVDPENDPAFRRTLTGETIEESALRRAVIALGSDVTRARVLEAFDESKHPRGKTKPGTNRGSFAPKGGGPHFGDLLAHVRATTGKKLRPALDEWAEHGDPNKITKNDRMKLREYLTVEGRYFSTEPFAGRYDYLGPPHRRDRPGRLSRDELLAKGLSEEEADRLEAQRRELLAIFQRDLDEEYERARKAGRVLRLEGPIRRLSGPVARAILGAMGEGPGPTLEDELMGLPGASPADPADLHRLRTIDPWTMTDAAADELFKRLEVAQITDKDDLEHFDELSERVAYKIDYEDLGEAARRIAHELMEGKAGGKLFGMGNATYDVEKMHKAAEGKPTVDVDARQFAHAFGEVRIEPTYAMKTNLSKPVLLAAGPNGAVRLVDGWHRAYKAAHVGRALKGRVLGEHELEACRVTEAAFDEKDHPRGKTTPGTNRGSFSPASRAAVRMYSDRYGHDQKANKSLRRRVGPKHSQSIQRMIDGLDEALSSDATKLAKPTTVYRGLRFTDQARARFLKSLEPGRTFTEPGFMSTSLDRDVASRFRHERGLGGFSATSTADVADSDGVALTIQLPAGAHALNVGELVEKSHTAARGGNKERLLPRGSTFEVVSVDGNHVTLKLVLREGMLERAVEAAFVVLSGGSTTPVPFD